MTVDRQPAVANRRIQQREIAARAGVSVSTVSRVLNNVTGISEAMQRRVMAAAAELGYRRLEIRAQPLLQNVGLFTSLPLATSLDPFHADILSGVETECGRQGIHLTYTTFGRAPSSAELILDRLKQNPVDGILLLSVDDPALAERLLALGLLIVMINVDQRELPVDTFLPDNRQGTLLAMRHLIAHGHQRILHLTRFERRTIRRRYETYQVALAEAGIPLDPALVVDTTLNSEHSYEILKQILAAGRPAFTAIFCANDTSALGAMRALQEAGLRIPEDISIVGFDDLPTTAFLSPPLTTVRVEREELGALAVRRLLDRAAMPGLTPIRVELACRLIKRQSVARVKVGRGG
jgi:DNA-binding LacI/PurR family transcriptional regulator